VAERLIGVDVGGTKVAVAALEGSGLAEVGSWPTDCDNDGNTTSDGEGVGEQCDRDGDGVGDE